MQLYRDRYRSPLQDDPRPRRVVENFFIRDIFMKDIPAEAILFDMYYMAKGSGGAGRGEKRTSEGEFRPVNETTLQFRNFQIQQRLLQWG